MEKELMTTASAEVTAGAKAEEISVSEKEPAIPGGKVSETAEISKEEHTDNKEEKSVSASGEVSLTEEDAKRRKSEMRSEFEKLIKGDYKEFYEERVKENLNRRFKENTALRKQNDANREIVEMLCDRYSIEPGNLPALKMALEADDAYLVGEANKRGIGIEEYKYIKRLESENRRHKENQAHMEAVRKANEDVERWYARSVEVKKIYPEFDIFAEASNPSFVSLIKNGIDVKTAYEVIHHNDIVARAADTAARDAEKKTVEAIKQRAMRPAENGLSSKSSAIYANGVSSLTPKDREEIARRAARGEKISF